MFYIPTEILERKVPKEPKTFIFCNKMSRIAQPTMWWFLLLLYYFVFIALKLYKYSSKTFTSVSCSQNNVIEHRRGSEAVGRRKMQKTCFFPISLYDFWPVEPQFWILMFARGVHHRKHYSQQSRSRISMFLTLSRRRTSGSTSMSNWNV